MQKYLVNQINIKNIYSNFIYFLICGTIICDIKCKYRDGGNNLEKIVVKGGTPLIGEVQVSGAKILKQYHYYLKVQE